MRKIYLIGIWAIIIVSFFSCKFRNQELNKTIELAGNNRIELLKVIDHYQNIDNSDPLKLKAAKFLIENMPAHGSIWSEAINTFKEKVSASDSLLPMKTLNNWWDSLKETNNPIFKPDLNNLKANFLIQNIDKAFEVWYTSPWKEDVNFINFCNHILPYRFEKELLADGWRDSLYQAYYPLVKDIKNLKEAYEIVYHTVGKQLPNSSSNFPYVIDVITIQHQLKATCLQRCIMIGSVMRALGIPAALDYVNKWGNYSTSGHTWVSLVTDDGTYTIYREEKEAHISNRIDASLFEVHYPISDNYELFTDFKKRCAKIRRFTFQHYEYTEKLDYEWEAVEQMTSPFYCDVSHEYNMKGEVEVQTNLPIKYAYICQFVTAQDWTPISFCKVDNGICHFSALADSVVYITMGYVNGKPVALEDPFIIVKNQKISFIPDKSNLKQIKVMRKYPLTGKWMNEWFPMIGGRFEGSDDPDFINKELLCSIESMPVFRNIMKVNNPKAVRYVRYVSPETCQTPIAEIEFVGMSEKLTASPGKSSVGGIERSIDNDTFSRPDIEKGYTFGYDLVTPQKITSITFFPRNDDNFVLPGHEYELFYYNNNWISLGKYISNGYELTYKSVPDNALLFLKDHTKGIEERPFTYKNGKQIWW